LVLADEPTGQLDHDTAEEMLNTLEEALIAINAALVLSTHDTRVAQRYTRQWQMADGKLLKES
jgi:ABC-type lipoprotein export system ATPase subunit